MQLGDVWQDTAPEVSITLQNTSPRAAASWRLQALPLPELPGSLNGIASRTRRANVVVLRNVLDVSAIQPADQSSDTSESASGPSEDLQPEHELGWLRFARSSGVLEPDARTTVQVLPLSRPA